MALLGPSNALGEISGQLFERETQVQKPIVSRMDSGDLLHNGDGYVPDRRSKGLARAPALRRWQCAVD